MGDNKAIAQKILALLFLGDNERNVETFRLDRLYDSSHYVSNKGIQDILNRFPVCL